MLLDTDGALWAGVVEQARDDVESLPLGSPDYDAAVAFLTSDSRYWRAARDDVGSHLFIDGDDIKRAGTRWVILRRRAEGLPDHEPQPESNAAGAKRAPREQPERPPLVVPSLLRAALRHYRPVTSKRPPAPPIANPGAR